MNLQFYKYLLENKPNNFSNATYNKLIGPVPRIINLICSSM